MVTSNIQEDSNSLSQVQRPKAQESLSLALVLASSFHQQQSDASDSNDIVIENGWDWQVLTTESMSTGRTGCRSVVVGGDLKLDEEIIVIGGSDGYWSQLNSLEVFNIRQQSWSSCDLVLHDARWHFASVAFLPPNQHKILVIGGWNNNAGTLSSVELIDWDLKTVTLMSRLQQARCKMAAVAISSTQILVAGGHDGANSMDTLEIYDLNTNSWNLIPSSERLQTPRSQCGAVLSQRAVYIAGGMNTLESLDTCDILDLDSFQITEGPKLQRPIENVHALSIGTNEQVAVFDDKWMQFLDEVSNQWVLVEIPMNDRRRAASAVAVGLEIFVFGGESSYARNKTVEKLSLDIPQAPPALSSLQPQTTHPETDPSCQSLTQPSLQQKHITELQKWIENVTIQKEMQTLELEEIQSKIVNSQEILLSELQADIYKEEQALEKALIKHQETIAALQAEMEQQQQNSQTMLIGLEITRTKWIEKVDNQLEGVKDRVSVIEFEMKNEKSDEAFIEKRQSARGKRTLESNIAESVQTEITDIENLVSVNNNKHRLLCDGGNKVNQFDAQSFDEGQMEDITASQKDGESVDTHDQRKENHDYSCVIS